jgi:hypothetical protein
MEETLTAIFNTIEKRLATDDIEPLRESFQELKWTMMCLLAIQRQENKRPNESLYQLMPTEIECLNRCLNDSTEK